MSAPHDIGTYPIGYSNTIVFEIQKEYENEVFEIDDYTVTIGDQTWTINESEVTTTTVNNKTTYLITWAYLDTDFTSIGQYTGCLSNNTKEINKYLDFKFRITFEDHC